MILKFKKKDCEIIDEERSCYEQTNGLIAIAPIVIPVAPIAIAVGVTIAVGAAIYVAYDPHRTNRTKSNQPIHEKGESRRKKDAGNEKKEKSGRYSSYKVKRTTPPPKTQKYNPLIRRELNNEEIKTNIGEMLNKE